MPEISTTSIPTTIILIAAIPTVTIVAADENEVPRRTGPLYALPETIPSKAFLPLLVL
jgi:hypothetical protein